MPSEPTAKMEEMNPLELWKKGIPISEAWLHFAPAEMRRQYEHPELSRKVNPKSGLGMLLRSIPDQSRRRALKEGAIQFQHGMQLLSSTSQLKAEMQNILLENIQRGK